MENPISNQETRRASGSHPRGVLVGDRRHASISALPRAKSASNERTTTPYLFGRDVRVSDQPVTVLHQPFFQRSGGLLGGNIPRGCGYCWGSPEGDFLQLLQGSTTFFSIGRWRCCCCCCGCWWSLPRVGWHLLLHPSSAFHPLFVRHFKAEIPRSTNHTNRPTDRGAVRLKA
jgi:hypothetical protein